MKIPSKIQGFSAWYEELWTVKINISETSVCNLYVVDDDRNT